MTRDIEAALHPDDADLVRLIDGALPEVERGAIEAHVRGCLQCRSRHITLERRSARLSALLRATDLPAPAVPLRVVVRRRKVAGAARRWQVAAAIVLAMGGAMAVSPVRAWMLNAARTVWARATGEATTSAVRTVAPSSAVSFVPSGSVLTVRVPAGSNGQLTIDVTEGSEASALGARAGSILVMPDEFRFTETLTEGADYQVRVPAQVTLVRVWVGQRVTSIRPTATARQFVVPLSAQ